MDDTKVDEQEYWKGVGENEFLDEAMEEMQEKEDKQ